MGYPLFSKQDLADFVGVPVQTLQSRVETALVQSSLLFTIVTEVSEVPDEEDKANLIKFAILEMAYDIYLKQPFVDVKAKPYQSETIGSYSYSIGSHAYKAMQGDKTGLMWWDLAISKIGQAVVISSGSIAVFDRDHNIWSDSAGNLVLVGPAEVTNYGLSYNDLNQGYPGDRPINPDGWV